MKRIYQENLDGTLSETNQVLDKYGNAKFSKSSNCSARMTKSQLVNKAAKMGISPNDIPVIRNNQKGISDMRANYQNPAIATAETADGNYVQVRAEAGGHNDGVAGGASQTMIIQLSNTGATTIKTSLGDGLGIIAASEGVAPSGNLVVDGTYGANTLSILKAACNGGAVDVHTMHLAGFDAANPGTANGAFFNGVSGLAFGKSVLGEESPAVKRMILSAMTTQETFNQNVRVLDLFRSQWDNYKGGVVTLAPGVGVTITIGVNAVSSAHLMQEQN